VPVFRRCRAEKISSTYLRPEIAFLQILRAFLCHFAIPLATLKHIASKNTDYGAAEQYLTFEHNEFTDKPILDENGRLVPHEDYLIAALNCGGEDFAVACMRANLRYGKNQQREDVKSHHYIISFDPRDGPDHGLTMERLRSWGNVSVLNTSPAIKPWSAPIRTATTTAENRREHLAPACKSSR